MTGKHARDQDRAKFFGSGFDHQVLLVNREEHCRHERRQETKKREDCDGDGSGVRPRRVHDRQTLALAADGTVAVLTATARVVGYDAALVAVFAVPAAPGVGSVVVSHLLTAALAAAERRRHPHPSPHDAAFVNRQASRHRPIFGQVSVPGSHLHGAVVLSSLPEVEHGVVTVDLLVPVEPQRHIIGRIRERHVFQVS